MNNKIINIISVLALIYGVSAFADGDLTSSATATVVVGESIAITTALSSINLSGVDVLDDTAASGSGTFTVKANSGSTIYDVWMSVPEAGLDGTNDVYLAANGDNKIPLNVALSGNTGGNAVSSNPGALQTGAVSTARPTTGNKSDGDAVAGTNRAIGTTYTVTLTENTSLGTAYPDIPAGSYTLTLTANIAHGD